MSTKFEIIIPKQCECPTCLGYKENFGFVSKSLLPPFHRGCLCYGIIKNDTNKYHLRDLHTWWEPIKEAVRHDSLCGQNNGLSCIGNKS